MSRRVARAHRSRGDRPLSLTAAAARVLIGQLTAELERVRREAGEIVDLTPADQAPDPTTLWAIAGHLQAFYSGIEAILIRILKEVDGVAPAGPDSHREVLRQAAVEVPGIRAAVLDTALIEALSPYRAFRHFFGHAYGVVLRWDKIERKAASARDAAERFASAIASFTRFLEVLASSSVDDG